MQEKFANTDKKEVLSDEKLLEQETGVNSSVLKKIKNNPKLRKIFLSLILTIGLAGATESVMAQSENIKVDGKENNNTKNNFGNLLKEIKAENLKEALKEYRPQPGDWPLGMILKKFEGYNFKITDPIIGGTHTGAELTATQTLILSGILSNETSRVFTFIRELKNGNISEIKVVAYK